jgi:hypothetical protein
MSETPDPDLLAFLDVIQIDDKESIRGGVLVTDQETKPYEFRCTGSVKPTSLQRILYGNTLQSYVSVDLIGRPLLKAAREKPVLVLVVKELLLQIRPTVAYPIILLQQSKKRTSGNNGVLMRVHPNYSSELKTAHAILDPLIEKRDLLEPFNRLKVAVEEAHRQGIGD